MSVVMQEEEKEWLTMPEVCKKLRLDRNTVMKRVEDGLLPARREGRGWRFKREHVDAYINSTWYSPERPQRE